MLDMTQLRDTRLEQKLRRYTDKMWFKLEIITPQRAQELLDKFNRNNRPLREGLAKKYCSRMALGKWGVDGQAIVIDETGQMVNGQHRCRACVMSGKSFISLVVYGVDPDARDTMDDHGPRSATDTMQRLHIPHPRATAKAAQVVIRYRNGSSRSQPKVANSDVADFITSTPDFEGWIAAANLSQRSTIYKSIPLVVGITYLAGQGYPHEAKAFLSSFSTGINLPAGSPVLALRTRYESDKRMRAHERVALAIQAWNAYIDGRRLERMVLYQGDNFPTIAGAPEAPRHDRLSKK